MSELAPLNMKDILTELLMKTMVILRDSDENICTIWEHEREILLAELAGAIQR